MPHIRRAAYVVWVAVVVCLAILGSALALKSTIETQRLMRTTVAVSIPSLVAAEELEAALLEQRGLVSAYMLEDGERAWLAELESRKPELPRWLAEARRTAPSPEGLAHLERLERVYRRYDRERDRAIALFQRGDVAAARSLQLHEVKALADEAHRLSDEYLAVSRRSVEVAMDRVDRRIRAEATAVGVILALTAAAGLALLALLSRKLLGPLRELAAEARSLARADGAARSAPEGEDDLREIGRLLRRLVADVRDTRLALEESRDRLLDSEQLATVGRMAAGVAHEIRNPLTAMRMWLFAIRGQVGEAPQMLEKCDLLADEIGRLDGIVGSFLELSRPPAPVLEPQDVSRLVDGTLDLLAEQIRRGSLRVLRVRAPSLPRVQADVQQLRQVFLNLLANAAEATPEGGEIRVSEDVETDGGSTFVTVRVGDTGPGIPECVRARLFEPFVTSKRNGTGLGLSIAAGIVTRHGGRLALESSDERGSVFAVRLPALVEVEG